MKPKTKQDIMVIGTALTILAILFGIMIMSYAASENCKKCYESNWTNYTYDTGKFGTMLVDCTNTTAVSRWACEVNIKEGT